MSCARLSSRVSGRASARSPCKVFGTRAVLAQAQKDDGPVLAIVGVTGAVGQEFLKVRPYQRTTTYLNYSDFWLFEFSFIFMFSCTGDVMGKYNEARDLNPPSTGQYTHVLRARHRIRCLI